MEMGLKCLDENRWTRQYDLALQLSLGAAEGRFCVGQYDAMQEHVGAVMKQEGPIHGKFRAYRCAILALGAQQRFGEAIEHGLHVLRELKFANIAKTASVAPAIWELMKTNSMLKKNSVPLSELPLLEDESRIAAMGIIYMTTTMSYITNPNLFLILYARVIRWNIQYGVCKYSPHAIGTYAVIVGGVLGDFQKARELCQHALALSERLGSKETLAKTIYAVYGFVYPLVESLRSCSSTLLYGHQVGMESGDIEIAMFNLASCLNSQLIAGSTKLDELAKRMEEACRKMKEYRQIQIRSFVLVLWQMTLNLSGRSKDSMVLSGEAMDEGEMREMAAETKNQVLEGFLLSSKMQLAYYFGDSVERAAQLAESSKDYGVKVGQGELSVPRHTFFQGMVWSEMGLQDARGNGSRGKGYARRVKGILKTMQKWVKNGNMNCLHLAQLLEAELAFLQGNHALAAAVYKKSIVSAGRACFAQDIAQAHERSGLFYLATEADTFWAAYHIDKAILGFQDWGATAKAEQLVGRYGDMLVDR
jgi:predicted ATPase